ncbi:hypothetical protein MHB46_02235 [Paenibacillus sp. FSL H7-0703]|uniref:hypothetical protein n=1 Tax=Paenibacillus sp. FSL H7-0703 TaxID=2921438 RepID=UPI0030FCC151
MQPVTIKLTEEQRFMFESQVDHALMIVKEIDIFPENQQINLNGTYFLVDLVDPQIIKQGEYTMAMDITERDVYENEEAKA